MSSRLGVTTKQHLWNCANCAHTRTVRRRGLNEACTAIRIDFGRDCVNLECFPIFLFPEEEYVKTERNLPCRLVWILYNCTYYFKVATFNIKLDFSNPTNKFCCLQCSHNNSITWYSMLRETEIMSITNLNALCLWNVQNKPFSMPSN